MFGANGSQPRDLNVEVVETAPVTERDEEGDLLEEATEKGVVKVARYYRHGWGLDSFEPLEYPFLG
jgi:hypothetical protein